MINRRDTYCQMIFIFKNQLSVTIFQYLNIFILLFYDVNVKSFPFCMIIIGHYAHVCTLFFSDAMISSQYNIYSKFHTYMINNYKYVTSEYFAKGFPKQWI